MDRRRLEPLLARPGSGAARRCRRSYRRPFHHRCRRRACPEKLRRRGSPVAAVGAIPSVLRSVGRLEGARSSRPAASHCPPPARSGAGSELLAAQRSAGMLRASRMGGDSFPLLDSRGGNYLPGVTGPGGGDSPAGMTRWAGIPPEQAPEPGGRLSQGNSSPGAPASWGSWEEPIQGDCGSELPCRQGLGRHLGGRTRARRLNLLLHST